MAAGRVVLVCGSRHATSVEECSYAFGVLDALHQFERIFRIVNGAATGYDKHASAWAKRCKISVVEYPAKWRPHPHAPIDYSAGFKRNSTMLTKNEVDLCVAFPGGNGTADMVAKCIEAGVPVLEVQGL